MDAFITKDMPDYGCIFINTWIWMSDYGSEECLIMDYHKEVRSQQYGSTVAIIWRHSLCTSITDSHLISLFVRTAVCLLVFIKYQVYKYSCTETFFLHKMYVIAEKCSISIIVYFYKDIDDTKISSIHCQTIQAQWCFT